jgi:hypothetical protein
VSALFPPLVDARRCWTRRRAPATPFWPDSFLSSPASPRLPLHLLARSESPVLGCTCSHRSLDTPSHGGCLAAVVSPPLTSDLYNNLPGRPLRRIHPVARPARPRHRRLSPGPLVIHALCRPHLLKQAPSRRAHLLPPHNGLAPPGRLHALLRATVAITTVIIPAQRILSAPLHFPRLPFALPHLLDFWSHPSNRLSKTLEKTGKFATNLSKKTFLFSTLFLFLLFPSASPFFHLRFFAPRTSARSYSNHLWS